MNDYCCPSCGREQELKLGTPAKASGTCPRCGKPLNAKNDEYALTVKAYYSKKGKRAAT